MATATKLKGVYSLNPTKAIMKTGSAELRRSVTSDVKGFKKVKPPKATTRKTK
jgi:hypothetical protein